MSRISNQLEILGNLAFIHGKSSFTAKSLEITPKKKYIYVKDGSGKVSKFSSYDSLAQKVFCVK